MVADSSQVEFSSVSRHLAIGDIHGCRRALESLLDLVAPTSDDTIVTLGDYVDRGPDSAGVVKLLLELDSSHSLVPLRGNHEIMMLDSRESNSWRESWLGYGGAETLASYSVDRNDSAAFDSIPVAHLEFLENRLLPYWETDTHIFVHAFAEANKPMSAQPDSSLFWRKFVNPEPHTSGKTVVCGHTPQRDGVPARSDGWICVDTFAYDDSGWLSCLDTGSETVWQANEAGRTRHFQLGEEPSRPT